MTSVGQMLIEAKRLIDGGDPELSGVWPTAAALLARQALEEAVAAYWRRRSPAMVAVSTRVQHICLAAQLGDPDTAYEVAYVWSTLSDACHYRSYDLGRTEAELRYLCDRVYALSVRLI
jgi:hypothetical protein